MFHNDNYFQEFNTLKEEFNEKFLGDDTDFNGFNNRAINFDNNNEELQELKVIIEELANKKV